MGLHPFRVYVHPNAQVRRLSGSRLLPLRWSEVFLSCPLPVHPRTEAKKPSQASEGARRSGRMWRGPVKVSTQLC